LAEISSLKKLDPEARLSIRETLEREISDDKHQDEIEFVAFIKLRLKEVDGITSTQIKAIAKHFGETDENAPIVTDSKGNRKPDPELRDTENVPLTEDIDDYVKREIEPHLDEFWIDRSKDKVGYEIPFTRHFYKYTSPRPLEEIDAELNQLFSEISELLKEVEK